MNLFYSIITNGNNIVCLEYSGFGTSSFKFGLYTYALHTHRFYVPTQRSWWGYTDFSLSVTVCRSVCVSVRPSVRPSVCRQHGFQDVSRVYFGILISSLSEVDCFQNWLISKWPSSGHIECCGFQALASVWLWISSPNFSSTFWVWGEAYWFSVISLSKLGGHIRFAGF